jgi:glycosyltransferase involved in cell wall biosynthesis
LASELGLDGRVVLGFIGSFYRYEGLDLLLQALAEIRRSVPNVVLLLVGGGPEAESLRAPRTKLALDDVALYRTGAARAGAELLRSGGFFVYPRRSIRLTELVTPLKPLEAMAQRRMVFASNVGGIAS